MSTAIQTGKVSIVLPASTLNALRAIAAQRQVSLSDVIRDMIRQAMEGAK